MKPEREKKKFLLSPHFLIEITRLIISLYLLVLLFLVEKARIILTGLSFSLVYILIFLCKLSAKGITCVSRRLEINDAISFHFPARAEKENERSGKIVWLVNLPTRLLEKRIIYIYIYIYIWSTGKQEKRRDKSNSEHRVQ